MIKVVYCNSVFCDIYDPVFPDTCGTIFEKLQEIIHFSACRRYNFNNPVWCAFTSFIIKFVWITNHRYIWFDISIIYFIKIYGEWCRKHFASSFVLFYIIMDDSGKLHDEFLMFVRWWCHIIDVSVNQFSSFAIWQSINIFNGIRFFFE